MAPLPVVKCKEGTWRRCYDRMVAAGVHFVRPRSAEAYGTVAVFLDIAGNRWDLLGPRPVS